MPTTFFILVLAALILQTSQLKAEILGPLDNPGNFDLTIEPGLIDYSIDMSTRNFTVVLPSNYDPNETYGLVAFNNASDSPAGPSTPWKGILDKYRLIWVSGSFIGNTQWIDTRRGVTLLGAMRMTELYNIDPERIYASGNSGGSRMSSGLTLMRDDFFTGFIGNVGAASSEALPDDWLTGDDTSYPEETSVSADSDTSIRSAFQTYYRENNYANQEGDFREQENMTILNFSVIPNGNIGKLVDSPGTHGTKLDYAFEECVKFMDHPWHPVIFDEFANTAITSNPDEGNGFSVISGTAIEQNVTNPISGSTAAVVLAPDSEIRSDDVFNWNDDFGLQMQTALRASFDGDYNQRIVIRLKAADLRVTTQLELSIEQVSATEKTASLVMFEDGLPPLTIYSCRFDDTDEPMTRGASDRAYFKFDAYDGLGYLFRGSDLLWTIDDDKFQINFRQDMDRSTFTSDLATTPILLIDRWTVQARWVDLGLTNKIERLKAIKDWRVSISNEKINTALAADDAYVDYIRVNNSQPSRVALQDGSESKGLLFVQDSGSDGRLAIEAELFDRQEVQGLHHWVSSTAEAGFSGAGAVATRENLGTSYNASQFSAWAARLEYQVEFTQTGTFKVWMRAHAPTTSDDSVWLGLNKNGQDALAFSGFSQSGYSWISQTINVSEIGRKKLYIWVGEDRLELDQFLMTANAAYIPTGPETADAGIEQPLPVNGAPTFSVAAILGSDATENESYTGSIAGTASDPEDDALSFSKTVGPAWLIVSEDGTLSGTPSLGDVGLNVFTVQVVAAGGFNTAILEITVLPKPGIKFRNTINGSSTSKQWTIANLNNTDPSVTSGNGSAIGFLKGQGNFKLKEQFTLTLEAYSGWNSSTMQTLISAGTFSDFRDGLTPALVTSVSIGYLGVNSEDNDPATTLDQNTDRLSGTNEALVFTVDTSFLASSSQLLLKELSFQNYSGLDRTDFIVFDASENSVIDARFNQNFNGSSTDILEGEWQLGDGDLIIIATGSTNGTDFCILRDFRFDVSATAGPETNMNDWELNYLPNLGAPTNDYDLDGMSNLFEYASGGDPTDPNNHGNLPKLLWINGNLTYFYHKRLNATDVSYIVETKANLTDPTWSTTHGLSFTPEPEDDLFDAMQATVPTNSDQFFLRLRVVQESLAY